MSDQKATLEYAGPTQKRRDMPWWISAVLIIFTASIMFGGWAILMILLAAVSPDNERTDKSIKPPPDLSVTRFSCASEGASIYNHYLVI